MNKVLGYLSSKKEGINKFLPYFFVSYIILLILPYCFGRVEVINLFFSSGWSKIIFRALTIGYGVSYLGLIGLSNRLKINPCFVIGASLLIVILLISTISSSPDVYRLDGTYVGTISTLEYVVDFVKFFFALILFIFIISFIHPVINDLKVFNYALFIIIGVSLLGVIFSFILEFNEIKLLILGGDEHAIDIHSFFQNKNAYGLFLFLASLSVGFLVYTNNDNKYLYLFIPLFIFTFMAIIAGCRTAFISCLALLLYLFIRSLIILKDYSKKTFKIVLIVIASILLLFILFMTIPPLHNGPLRGLYNVVLYTFVRMGDALFGRANIWSDTIKFMDGMRLAFGCNLTNSKYLLIIYNGHFKDFHSGYVNFFACFGILGTLIYASLFVYIFYLIVKVIMKKPLEGILVLIFLLVSMLYAFPEIYTLFLSTSLFTFVTNLIVVVYLLFLLKEDKA